MDRCVADEDLDMTENAPRPTLAGALRFGRIMDECTETKMEGIRNGVKYAICGADWGRVEADAEAQRQSRYCQGVASVGLPVGLIAPYMPSGAVYLQRGNQHAILDLREAMEPSDDLRQLIACAHDMVRLAAFYDQNGVEHMPQGGPVRNLYDCMVDNMGRDALPGWKSPIVWEEIPAP
ncbi:MAG: hypothetical protein M3O22_06865 [Pseudomonadota bacterium]|nr:hypothetical protein [Pseudomonadota bacterium]